MNGRVRMCRAPSRAIPFLPALDLCVPPIVRSVPLPWRPSDSASSAASVAEARGAAYLFHAHDPASRIAPELLSILNGCHFCTKEIKS